MNVGLAVTRSARRYGPRLAVFDGDRELTWSQLEERSNRFGNAIIGRYGLERGDRRRAARAQPARGLEVLAGTAKAGLTYVGMNFRLSWHDLEAILANAEPRLLVTEHEYAELAHQAGEHFDLPVLDVDAPAYAELLREAAAKPPDALHQIRPEDDFCIVYTSGTTGTPKGVLFDHGRVLQHATVAALEYEIDRDTRYLVAIPHNSSVNITFVPGFTMGSAIGFSDSRGFDPERFAAEVKRHQATHTYLVPTQLYRLLEQLPTQSRDLSSISTLGYGAAPMAPDKVGALVERFGPIFNQLYGMAEIASIGTMLRKDDHVAALQGKPHLLASAGQPSYAIDVRVVDDDGHDVPAGERGEVVFAAPYMMKGYYRDPERTAAHARSTAGSTPATSASSTRRATSRSSTARRTSSSAAATTSPPPRSRPSSTATRRSWRSA